MYHLSLPKNNGGYKPQLEIDVCVRKLPNFVKTLNFV